MDPPIKVYGSLVMILLLLHDIILEGAASKFRLYEKQHTTQIKCVNGYQLFVREGVNRETCLFLCYAKYRCTGVRFDRTRGVCYGCRLFSEVAPGSEVDSHTILYMEPGKYKYILAARINSATGVADTGRIEIRYNNTWGAICDDRWANQLNGYEVNNIKVMCNMLGFGGGGGLTASWMATIPKDVGIPILMDDVECTGTEVTIADCRFRGFGAHDCDDDEYLGLNCLS